MSTTRPPVQHAAKSTKDKLQQVMRDNPEVGVYLDQVSKLLKASKATVEEQRKELIEAKKNSGTVLHIPPAYKMTLQKPFSTGLFFGLGVICSSSVLWFAVFLLMMFTALVGVSLF